jgi:1-deoxy-D-xylulose-5-phosphate synthase
MGSAILEFMNTHGYQNQITILGIPDIIVEHGSLKELHHECNYDALAIAEAVKALLAKDNLVEV